MMEMSPRVRKRVQAGRPRLLGRLESEVIEACWRSPLVAIDTTLLRRVSK